MQPATLQAIKAVVKADTTLPKAQQDLILAACRGDIQQESKTAPTYYTRQQVADFLVVDVRTVDRYIHQGKIKAVQLPGGAVRIPADCLGDFKDHKPKKTRLHRCGKCGGIISEVDTGPCKSCIKKKQRRKEKE